MNKFLGVGIGLLGGLIRGIAGNAEETNLRTYLFDDYNKDVRPVLDHGDSTHCRGMD